MVKPRKRIAKKPPTADDWVSQGGTDPEIEKPATPVADVEEEIEEEVEEKGKRKYPHRVSFDLDNAQYKRLKRAAFEEECSMNEILREAIEDWMQARNY